LLFTEFEELGLDGLEVVATLGIGGFGRVALVQVIFFIFSRERSSTGSNDCFVVVVVVVGIFIL
jgi:hypothetical protein